MAIHFHVTNQTPVDFTKVQVPYITNPTLDFKAGIQNAIQDLIKQIFTPLKTGQTQMVLNNQPYTQDDLTDDLVQILSQDDEQPQLSDRLSVILHQASAYNDQQVHNFRNIIANSYLLKNNLPLPSPTSLYTYDTDLKTASRMLVKTNNDTWKQKTILGLMGVLEQETLNDRWQFIFIQNTDEYTSFKSVLNQIINTNKNPELIKSNTQAQNIQLDSQNTFTSWTAGGDNDTNAFNRYIETALATNNNQILPINLHALVDPIGFSFINLEALANTDQFSFQHEINQLGNLTNRMVQFKIKKLSQVTTAQKLHQQNQHAQKKNYTKQHSQSLIKRYQRGFQKTIPSVNQQIKRLSKIVIKFTSQIQSDNSYHQTYSTFMRPNRRYPDDPNLRGHIQTIKYRPDIHIYLDTSGSISEAQYKTSVLMLIYIAKKLHTNLYFTSFSDEITQPVKLMTKNVSPALIYKQIQAVPKISGGTEYENVWNSIDIIDKQNKVYHQAPRLNFMITDFAYDLRSTWTPRIHQASTKSLFYLPMAADQYDYNNCRGWAKDFANELFDHGDLKIYSRILM